MKKLNKKLIIFVLIALAVLSAIVINVYSTDGDYSAECNNEGCSNICSVTIKKSATCSETGLLEYTCIACGTYTVIEPALGDDMVTLDEPEVYEPTCTEDGYIILKRCSRCSAYEGQIGDPATGHSVSDEFGVFVPVDPTCTSNGVRVKCYKCSECGGYIAEDGVTELDYADVFIPATGHGEMLHRMYVEPTCVNKGQVEHWLCVECKGTFEDEEGTTPIDNVELDLVEHNYLLQEAKEATCEEDGWIEFYSCGRSNCNKYFLYVDGTYQEVDVVDVAIPATSHNKNKRIYDTYLKSAATCTSKAKYYYYCDKCNTKLNSTYEYGDLAPHTEGTAVEENRVEATCTAAGSYDSVVYCTVCNTEISRTTQTIETKVHTPGEAERENEVAATCTEDGSYEEVVYCTVCNAEISRTTETIPAAHDWIDVNEEVPPTCTESGYVIEKICSYGDSEMIHETTPALGHDEVNHSAKAPTCTEKGWDAYVTCSRCDYTTYKEKAALGHTEVIDAKVDATCTTTGLTEGKHCSVCNTVIVAQEEVPMLGHSFGEWVVDKEATYEEDGHKYRLCVNCNTEKEEQIIPKLTKEEITISTTHIVKEIENTKYIEISEAVRVEDFLKKITSNSEIIIQDKNGNQLASNAKVPTGAKVITKEDVKEQYIVILKGDVDCNGEIAFRDIISTNAIRINGTNGILKAQLFAADINNTNKIEFRDIIMLNAIRIMQGNN